MAIPSTVVDEVPYASPDDVLKHVRNRDTFSDPGESEAISMLLDRTEFVDSRTNRAWRRREATQTRPVKLSHLQKHSRHRRRSRYKSGRRLRDPTQVADAWAIVQLPALDIESISELVLYRGRSFEDLTSDGGEASEAVLSDDLYIIEPDRGRLKIHINAVTVGNLSAYGKALVDDATVRVTYQYGPDESSAATEVQNGNVSGTSNPATTSEGVSTSVPGDLRDAVGKLVASDIARMDSLGDMFRTSGEDLDLTDAADALRSDAMETIQEHRRIVP